MNRSVTDATAKVSAIFITMRPSSRTPEGMPAGIQCTSPAERWDVNRKLKMYIEKDALPTFLAIALSRTAVPLLNESRPENDIAATRGIIEKSWGWRNDQSHSAAPVPTTKMHESRQRETGAPTS